MQERGPWRLHTRAQSIPDADAVPVTKGGRKGASSLPQCAKATLDRSRGGTLPDLAKAMLDRPQCVAFLE
jgi:hypothetical protein